MSSVCSVVNPRNTAHSHCSSRRRRVQLISRKLLRAAHVMGPTLVALSLVGVANVAHAQGTMDFSGAQTLMGTFKTVLELIRKAGGWHPGLYLKIDNPPYMELVIEAMDESGPCGLPAISVAHYGEQNGDAMRDPEMCFELGLAGGVHLSAFYYRNDYAGVEQWSRFIREGMYAFHTQLHREHERFAALWDKNLNAQRFVEAFTDKCIRG